MKCKGCNGYLTYIRQPGTIIWNAKVKNIGYTFFCPLCKWEAKPSRFYYVAMLYYWLGIENKYKGQVRATAPDWGYHDI